MQPADRGFDMLGLDGQRLCFLVDGSCSLCPTAYFLSHGNVYPHLPLPIHPSPNLSLLWVELTYPLLQNQLRVLILTNQIVVQTSGHRDCTWDGHVTQTKLVSILALILPAGRCGQTRAGSVSPDLELWAAVLPPKGRAGQTLIPS